MIRVCYLIQSYKQFDQILRLATTLRRLSPNAVILLSHSLGGCSLDESALKDQGVYLTYAQGGRSNFSLTQAYLDAIEWLLVNKVEFDWFTNLTAQDYPIKSASHIENVLASTQYDGFLEYFSVFSSDCPWSKGESESRYLYQYRPLVKQLSNQQKKLCAPLKLVNKVQPFVRVRNDFDLRIGTRRGKIFSDSFVCYGGSYFSVLSRKCIEYIQEFTKNNRSVIDYFRNVCFPDESLIQTILVNNQDLKLLNQSYHYFDFYEGNRNGHPRTLGASDYPDILHCSHFFARKFDMQQDSYLLDLIDVEIVKG